MSSGRQEGHLTQDPRQERAVLAGVLLPEDEARYGADDDPLEELEHLATTAGVEVVGSLLQRRSRPTARSFLGEGKVQELLTLVRARDARVVLVDNDLTPAQARNLEEALHVKVLDRTQVILDIFARHARSRQARLQVHLAQLEYLLPRLAHMWKHLERLGGGIGTRGPGESQLESDRRVIRKRVSDARRQLGLIKSRREREVAARSEYFTVCLVGYTNAGKSTLHRALTGSQVDVRDQLFATLDTKTSAMDLPGGGKLLVSDTVGFIRRLPHHLVESFHATLEEARNAALLLHVVDASDPAAPAQILIVHEELARLEMAQIPRILVLNKVDRVEDPLALQALRDGECAALSARTGQGMSELRTLLAEHYAADFVTVEVEAPAGEGRLLAQLESCGRVLDRQYREGSALVRVSLSRADLARLERESPGFRYESVATEE